MPAFFAISTQCFAFHKPCRGAAQFLQAEMRRPASPLPVQFYVIRTTFGIFFKTLYGTTFPHSACLHKFMNNQTLPLRAGCRGRQPLHLVQTNSLCRKIATLFADFTLCYGIEKAVQSFVLRHRFVLITTLYFFFTFSAPLGRLTPIEALPQAPQGTLSLDPASPLTPGLCLRFISRYARC